MTVQNQSPLKQRRTAWQHRRPLKPGAPQIPSDAYLARFVELDKKAVLQARLARYLEKIAHSEDRKRTEEDLASLISIYTNRKITKTPIKNFLHSSKAVRTYYIRLIEFYLDEMEKERHQNSDQLSQSIAESLVGIVGEERRLWRTNAEFDGKCEAKNIWGINLKLYQVKKQVFHACITFRDQVDAGFGDRFVDRTVKLVGHKGYYEERLTGILHDHLNQITAILIFEIGRDDCTAKLIPLNSFPLGELNIAFRERKLFEESSKA